MSISRRTMALGTALLMTAILGACSGDDAGPGGGESDEAGMQLADEVGGGRMIADQEIAGSERSAASAPWSGGSAEPGVLGAPDDLPLSPVGTKVIKTAQLRIEVSRRSFQESLQAAVRAAESVGGYVLTTEIEGGRSRSGSITIRVPSERFEATLGELKRLGKVNGEQVSGQDVSEEFIDLEARRRNLEAQESVLLRLMERAQSIPATIRVQRELSRTQLEIERISGRLRFLEDQTAYSTITAHLREEGVAAPRAAGVLARAWEQAKSTTLAVISGVIIGAGFLVPLLVLAAIGWLMWKIVAPRFRKAPAT